MTQQQKNRIKSLFLLLVFSLNTVAGFACSVGVDMGYNKHHHDQGQLHSPKHGQEHDHYYHNQLTSTSAFKQANNHDDCCANDVAKITQLDKSIADNSLHLQTPVILLAFAAACFSQTDNVSEVAVNSSFQFVRRSCFLNDTDLRIAIQSFQI